MRSYYMYQIIDGYIKQICQNLVDLIKRKLFLTMTRPTSQPPLQIDTTSMLHMSYMFSSVGIYDPLITLYVYVHLCMLWAVLKKFKNVLTQR